MAVTESAIGVLTVLGKERVLGRLRTSSRLAGRLHSAVEIAAPLSVIALGLLFLI